MRTVQLVIDGALAQSPDVFIAGDVDGAVCDSLLQSYGLDNEAFNRVHYLLSNTVGDGVQRYTLPHSHPHPRMSHQVVTL